MVAWYGLAVAEYNVAGRLAEERLTQTFCGLESEYENISAVKNVYLRAGAGPKYQFIQFEFNDEKSAEQFSSRLDKTVDGKLLSTITLREYQKQVKMFQNANNLGITDNIQTKVLLVHNRLGMDVDTLFPSKKSVKMINIGMSKVSVVEFNTEKEATEAFLHVGDVPVGPIISLTDYLSLHAGKLQHLLAVNDQIDCRAEGAAEHCEETEKAGERSGEGDCLWWREQDRPPGHGEGE